MKGTTLFLLGARTPGHQRRVAFLERPRPPLYTAIRHLPRQPTLRVQPVPRRFVPVLEIRDPFYWDAFDSTWSLRNRTNTHARDPEEWGGHVDYALSCTPITPCAADRYFAEHLSSPSWAGSAGRCSSA